MFTFENLEVYKLSFEFSKKVFRFIDQYSSVDDFLKRQLKRATLSVNLNIAEGSGRFSMPDRRHFFVISRGSVLEVASILKLLESLYPVDVNRLSELLTNAENISRTLFFMIKGIDPKKRSKLN